MDQYPTIKLIVERGDRIAWIMAALPVLGALGLVALGVHWAVIIAGLVAGAVLLFLMRSYVELVRVIADMLLPK